MVPEITPDSANPVLTLEEKVDALTAQLSQLVNSFLFQNPIQSPHPYVHEAQAEDEIGDFLSHHEEESKTSGDGKIQLPKFTPPQTFDGMMKDTKSFISSIILYIKGRKPEFHTTESKIMFALLYMQGGKAQFWRNEAINQIAIGHEPFRSFQDFLQKLEAQFGDPNLKATAVGKLKTMRQGSLSADEFMLQFKAEASQTDLGDAALIKYLKAGLNQSLFKSIYRLPVMPTTLEEWYEWAFKLDWQYRQEQAESKLLHPHTGSKFGKPYGGSYEK
jgi:Retrotransposon gag protein